MIFKQHNILDQQQQQRRLLHLSFLLIVTATAVVVAISTTTTITTKMMIFSSNISIRYPFTNAFMWIPQRIQTKLYGKKLFHERRGVWLIGITQRDTSTTATGRFHRDRRYSGDTNCLLSSTALSEAQKQASPSTEMEATTTLASTLCGDDLSLKARSDFGGIQYYNTDVDTRFRVLFVLGGPGSGKGTQSALMEENYPVNHFSVGELLRNVPDQSPHKATIDAKLIAGQIVPVEISLSLLKEKMEQTASKHALFLVDGFPRNFDNLSGWARVMCQVAALEAVLVYQCPFPVLQERILERAKLSGRSDDNIESVKKRFKTFEMETIPVVDVLRTVSQNVPHPMQRWNVIDISGDRPVEEVWDSTQHVLNQLIQSDVLTANAALISAIQRGDHEAYEALCDPLFFLNSDVVTVMQEQEGTIDTDLIIQNAEIEIISGRQVTVSYDRQLNSNTIREKRFWCHQDIAGWRNIHFVRTPKTK